MRLYILEKYTNNQLEKYWIFETIERVLKFQEFAKSIDEKLEYENYSYKITTSDPINRQ